MAGCAGRRRAPDGVVRHVDAEIVGALLAATPSAISYDSGDGLSFTATFLFVER